eukprot:2979218-Rhodomonas_salina.2
MAVTAPYAMSVPDIAERARRLIPDEAIGSSARALSYCWHDLCQYRTSVKKPRSQRVAIGRSPIMDTAGMKSYILFSSAGLWQHQTRRQLRTLHSKPASPGIS